MGSNLHKDLTDSQIHVPKGFSTASNSTALTKDSGGSLVWLATGTGFGSNILSFPFRGIRKAKNATEYNSERTQKIDNTNTWVDSEAFPATPTAIEIVEFGRWVAPVNCTIESIIVRAYSASATMECSLKCYVSTYDCATTPTTITTNNVVTIIDTITIPAGELHCVETTSFTTSALVAGDIITMTSMINLVYGQGFYYNGIMKLKIT
tara:strand:- start:528 stop:1151 length:624 start_codon:yes stop_codon:yes gene_type:complete